MTRAVGIIRVSRVKGRDREERFYSPENQRDRIAEECERQGLELVATYDEMNRSGGADLAKRDGLRRSVEAVEAGRAEVVVVGYFDRLFRSLKVQAEVIERVEEAGGRLLAVDVGKVSNGTAAEWLNSTMHGMFAEYVRRQTAEKTAEAQTSAIERGIPPFPLIPGLIRVGDHIEKDPHLAPVVAEAVRMRAEGATINEVRAHLAEAGVKRSYHGVMSLLRSRLLIGEIVFGDQRGTVPAIIEDPEVWKRALRMRSQPGRKGKSDRLLARLGVLVCGTCGSRMVVGTATFSTYFIYRCPPNGDCQRRVTISAEVAEEVATEAVREGIAGLVGIKSLQGNVRAARVKLERMQTALDDAIHAFAGLETEPAAIERLAELRRQRDEARAEVDRLGTPDDDVFLLLAEDWEQLSLADRRRCIRAVIDRIEVVPAAPGVRGKARLTVKYHDPIARLQGRTPPAPTDLR